MEPTTDDQLPARQLPLSLEMKHIQGWGIDANPRNDPTYPQRHRIASDHQDWDRPPQQSPSVELLRSNERPTASAVFGTSAPPSGLSGAIRRFAFKYSEGTFTHWLALLLADRVNMVEGVAQDLAQGHVPNIIAETGLKAQWEHDRPAVVRKLVIGAAVATVAVMLLSRNRKD